MSDLPPNALLDLNVVVTCNSTNRIYEGQLRSIAFDGSLLLGSCKETRVFNTDEYKAEYGEDAMPSTQMKITRDVGLANIPKRQITNVYAKSETIEEVKKKGKDDSGVD
mmetsp:Transcript_29147/g.55043  ORF Transcript_29147/g.55043 Transcript_29147/m.55043 type:complete len:109 (+) Transcript_29147:195-521(+)|eukprot:CAMPEP_0182502612 /NCGR_PEP_ID=MMETSP1321-20130603/13807_1 /TAXON_ID=91990 /ORGANISM="Bolidomonas sp., Strain RCC1657" /LENGTH=108 /DNA_ID=CAMNT_0024707591 /DNA_START=150 /DNA_END=476 /DNA_ORIENTATION=-